MPVQSIMTLILLEVFNPFYVFQLFTIGVWLAEPYYYYCIAVVLMSTFGVATSVIQTKKVRLFLLLYKLLLFKPRRGLVERISWSKGGPLIRDIL